MDYRNLNNGAFEFMMKNALIERYKDEVQSLRKETEKEEFDFADALKKELDRKNSSGGGSQGGNNVW